MKKFIALFLAAVLLFSVVACSGGKTSDDSSGKVDVDLVELGENGQDFEDIEGAMPGMNYAKVVKAENVGGADAWVRIKLNKTVEPAKGVTAQLDPGLVGLDVQDGLWKEKDGWYYYSKALRPGESSEALFTSVSLHTDMANEWQNARIFIDVFMEATQVANNGSTVFEAAGWPDKY